MSQGTHFPQHLLPHKCRRNHTNNTAILPAFNLSDVVTYTGCRAIASLNQMACFALERLGKRQQPFTSRHSSKERVIMSFNNNEH